MDRFSKITLQNDNITTTKFNGSNFGKKPFPYRLKLPIHVEEKTLYKLMFFLKSLLSTGQISMKREYVFRMNNQTTFL